MELSQPDSSHKRAEQLDPNDKVYQVGEWYYDAKKKKHWCIYRTKSNCICLNRYSIDNDSEYQHTTSKTVSYDWADKRLTPSEEIHQHFLNLMDGSRDKLKEKTLLLSHHAAQEHHQDGDSMLPSVTVTDPKVVKQGYIKLRDQTLPEIRREIKVEVSKIAAFASCLAMGEKFKIDAQIKKLGDLNEKILQVELYGGLDEHIQTIRKGKPAPKDAKITIYQAIRYMDEECLADYQVGGIRSYNANLFDDWLNARDNADRILPAEKCIVGIQIRRKTHQDANRRFKDFADAYGEAAQIREDQMTYLYIRNGENIYCLATQAEFKQLIPEESAFDFTAIPKDFDYDDQLESVKSKSQTYNKIYVVLQGLIDRSTVFLPMTNFKVWQEEAMDRLEIVRDLENAIETKERKAIDYLQEATSSIQKGSTVLANWKKVDRGRGYNYEDRTRHFRQTCEVVRVSRDKKTIRLKWFDEYHYWSDWRKEQGKWKYQNLTLVHPYTQHWQDGEGTAFPISFYTLGDYMEFADSPQKECYEDWTPYILEAEDIKRNEVISLIQPMLKSRQSISIAEIKSICKNAAGDGHLPTYIITDYLAKVGYSFDGRILTQKPNTLPFRYIFFELDNEDDWVNIQGSHHSKKPNLQGDWTVIIDTLRKKVLTYSGTPSSMDKYITKKPKKKKERNISTTNSTEISYKDYVKLALETGNITEYQSD